jgi:hypothetical protein
MSETEAKWSPYTNGKWQGRPVIGWRTALESVRSRNEILVGVDDVIGRWLGGEAAQALHIVVPHDYYKSLEPTAYAVELVRPRWLYGAEGELYSDGLRYIGYLDIDYNDGFEEELTPEEPGVTSRSNGSGSPANGGTSSAASVTFGVDLSGL